MESSLAELLFDGVMRLIRTLLLAGPTVRLAGSVRLRSVFRSTSCREASPGQQTEEAGAEEAEPALPHLLGKQETQARILHPAEVSGKLGSPCRGGRRVHTPR